MARRGTLLFALLGAGVALTAPVARAQVSAPPPRVEEDDPNGRTTATPATGAAADTAPGKAGTAEVEAEPATGAASPAPPAPATPGGATTPKRALPDYDGRGEPPTTAGDVLLWIPRILLSPIYFVTEYVIRRPIGAFITKAEKEQWAGAITNFFTFGPDKKAGVVPTALIDFGFKPSVGVYAFWDDLLGKDNHLRLHASTWGADWVQGSVADKIPIGKEGFFDLRFEGVSRPDRVFFGMGPRSLAQNETRYGIDELQAHPVFETTWWKGSRITVEAGVKYVRFHDENCCDDPSLRGEITKGHLASPPGFDNGYTEVYQHGELTIDTRDPRPANQSGVRVELGAEQAANAQQAADTWLKYGGSVGGFWDIKANRVVSLSATALFVDPLADGAVIPFTEQQLVGGTGAMRGYILGRLADRSAAVATLKYRWPIWTFLDGTMQAAFGNVFDAGLKDFKPSLLRLSSALGVESIGEADHTFEFLIGFGTETFADGFDVDQFRLVFGTNRSF